MKGGADMSRIGMRTGEALVEGDKDYLCAEPEIVIGELDGPVGTALATLLGDQVKGHTRVFAILNSDVQVKPATLETGLVVQVPPFVNEGDTVRVNTETGEYQSRA